MDSDEFSELINDYSMSPRFLNSKHSLEQIAFVLPLRRLRRRRRRRGKFTHHGGNSAVVLARARNAMGPTTYTPPKPIGTTTTRSIVVGGH